MPLAQGDNMVGALATDRSDQPLGEAVLPTRAWGNRLVADTDGPQSTYDGRTIDPVRFPNHDSYISPGEGRLL